MPYSLVSELPWKEAKFGLSHLASLQLLSMLYFHIPLGLAATITVSVFLAAVVSIKGFRFCVCAGEGFGDGEWEGLVIKTKASPEKDTNPAACLRYKIPQVRKRGSPTQAGIWDVGWWGREVSYKTLKSLLWLPLRRRG